MTHVDIIVVGAGIAGASLGAELAASRSVLLLEMEEQPGYHATGRSVAFWEESYGGPAVKPLTTASGPLMRAPDPALSDRPFLSPRGALHIGTGEMAELRDAMLREFGDTSLLLKPLSAADLQAAIPGLRDGWTLGLAEPSCADIDAAAMHQAYLRLLRRRGGDVLTDVRLRSARAAAGGWTVEAGGRSLSCSVLVNAAGAWADEVAMLCGVRPLGIRPYQRTVVQLRTRPGPPVDLPVIMDLAGSFYFKPDGSGHVWLSPHDETPADPGDAAPEELAVAEAIDRFEQVVDWRIEAVERKWAGLRSFAPDRLPVYGRDAGNDRFFWCAGQGGFGIQTAPAGAKLAAALLTGEPSEESVAGIDAAPFSPARFP